MAGDWKKVRLGNYIQLKGGLSYKGKFVGTGDGILVGMGAVSYLERFLYSGTRRYGGEFSEQHRLLAGDLVIATRQQSDHLPILGFPAMIPSCFDGKNIIVATNLYKVINQSEIDNKYLYWLLRGQAYKNHIISSAKGTTVRMITKDAIEDFWFECPPPDERRAISIVLDSFDEKIELNRKMNQTVEAMARALFQSWFVDFDPVHAKAEGRDTGLPQHIADLFPDSFEDSEFGEIPKGWRVGTLGDFARLNPESWSKGTTPLEIEYVDLTNTKWGRIEATKSYSWEDAPSRAQRVLRIGDTIIGTVRPGNGSYTLIAQEGLTGSTGFAVLRPQKGIFKELVYLAATTKDNIDRLQHLADGGAYPAIRPEEILATKITNTSIEIIHKFSVFTEPLLSKMAQNDLESVILAVLRDTLLPKLISGELQVQDVEKYVLEDYKGGG